MTTYESVQVGDVLAVRAFSLTRAQLVRYAGASGDFNPIHWSERIATGVGLPGVIAHGMLTMALGGRVLSDWAGDPGAVVEYSVRFTKPVVVPDDDTGTVVQIGGTVTAKHEDGTATVELSATCGADKVLGQARGRVRLRTLGA